MKSLLKIPYYLLIAAVAAMGLLLLATMVPVPGNFKVKIVKSGSMEPTIMTGGIVVVRPENSYGVGDIITFGPDTKTQIPTTHRIVAEEGSGSNKIFHTKGDANDAEDPSATKVSAVDGKVVFSLSYVGYVLDFARKPLGFVLLVGIPALIVILDELSKIWKEIKRMRNKRGGSGRYGESSRIEYRNESRNTRNVLDLRMVQKSANENGKQNKKSFSYFKVVSLLLLMISPIVSLGRVGSTVSYYNERETSGSNTLQASADFGISPPEPLVAKLDLNTDSQVIVENDLGIIGDATSTDATTTPDVGLGSDATSTPSGNPAPGTPPIEEQVQEPPTPPVEETVVDPAPSPAPEPASAPSDTPPVE